MITEANAASPCGDTREPALVARAHQGDSDAFAELYKEHRTAVYVFILHRVDRDRTLAEDLTADVFARAFAKLATFTWAGKSILAWLYTIARHRVTDHYKASATQRLTYCEELFDVSDIWTEASPATEDLVLAELADQELHLALQRLRPSYRHVLVLRFLRECSVGEAAAAMSLTTGALKTLQYRATRDLRRTMLAVAA